MTGKRAFGRAGKEGFFALLRRKGCGVGGGRNRRGKAARRYGRLRRARRRSHGGGGGILHRHGRRCLLAAFAAAVGDRPAFVGHAGGKERYKFLRAGPVVHQFGVGGVGVDTQLGVFPALVAISDIVVLDGRLVGAEPPAAELISRDQLHRCNK